jgi:hypothetical protein
MGIATVLDEENLASEKCGGRSETAQTYIWWHLKLAPYRGKWSDMHQLAHAWHMSPSDSLKNFQNVVRRTSKDVTCTSSLGTAWDSVLSEKV